MATIFTGLYKSQRPYPFYFALGIYVPFLDFGIPVLPIVLISAVSAFLLFNINDKYSHTIAMSDSPEWAARCQISYFFLVIICYILAVLLSTFE